MVVTFDEQGGYGHPDHIAIHYQTKAAFAAAADPCRYPQQLEAGLETHQAQKLYYTSIPRRFFREMLAKMEELGLEIPERYLERLEGDEAWGLPDDACTTDVHVQDFWDAKTGGDPMPRYPAQPRQHLCPVAGRPYARSTGLGVLPTGRELCGRRMKAATTLWPG